MDLDELIYDPTSERPQKGTKSTVSDDYDDDPFENFDIAAKMEGKTNEFLTAVHDSQKLDQKELDRETVEEEAEAARLAAAESYGTDKEDLEVEGEMDANFASALTHAKSAHIEMPVHTHSTKSNSISNNVPSSPIKTEYQNIYGQDGEEEEIIDDDDNEGRRTSRGEQEDGPSEETKTGSPGGKNTSAFYGSASTITLHANSEARARLIDIMDSLHDPQYKPNMVKQKYEVHMPDGEVKHHWKIIPKGSKYHSTPPVHMSSFAAKDVDYREYRPTSPDRKMHPSKPRSKEPYLLPSQNHPEDPSNILSTYDGKGYLRMVNRRRTSIEDRINKTHSEYEKKILKAIDHRVERLTAVHKREYRELDKTYKEFEVNPRVQNLMDVKKFPTPHLGKKFHVTEEQVEYVSRVVGIELFHNQERTRIMTSLIKNRQKDEIAAMKDNQREPKELLVRTTDAQMETIETIVTKVLRAVKHCDKTIKGTKNEIDPRTKLRTQRTLEFQLAIIRKAMHNLDELDQSIDNIYRVAFLDFFSDFPDDSETDNGGNLMVGEDGFSIHKDDDDSGGNNHPSSRGRVARRPATADPIYQRKGSPSPKPTFENAYKLRPKSCRFYAKTLYRQVGKNRYRTRSPPRGTPIDPGVETKAKNERPKSPSFLYGNVPRGKEDILIKRGRLPYSARQLGKGRIGKKDLGVGLPTLQKQLDDMRPLSAPANVLNSEFLDGTYTAEERWLKHKKEEAHDAGHQHQNEHRHNKRMIASASKVVDKKKSKDRPKQVKSATTKVSDGTDGDNMGKTTVTWDPNMFTDVENDDDASVGIIQDDDEEASIADSIGEGDGIAFMREEDFDDDNWNETKRDRPRLRSKSPKNPKSPSINKRNKNVHSAGNKRRTGLEEMCSCCGKYFEGKVLTIPVIGVSPSLQEKFREKQLVEQKKVMQMEAANRSDKAVKRLLSGRKSTMKQFGVHKKPPMKVFCSWECTKLHAMKTCHTTMRFDMDTLINLTAGYIVMTEDD